MKNWITTSASPSPEPDENSRMERDAERQRLQDEFKAKTMGIRDHSKIIHRDNAEELKTDMSFNALELALGSMNETSGELGEELEEMYMGYLVKKQHGTPTDSDRQDLNRAYNRYMFEGVFSDDSNKVDSALAYDIQRKEEAVQKVNDLNHVDLDEAKKKADRLLREFNEREGK